ELCEDKPRNIVSSTGFCYSDVSSGSSHPVSQIQGFESNPDPDIFNLAAGMEMIGFSKNLPQQGDSYTAVWKGSLNKHGSNPDPSSNTINESKSDFYQHEFHKPEFTAGISETETSTGNLIVGAETGPWQENRLLVDDSSYRCVFPCEGNERPSQSLSLSLSSNNPSTIGLQSFELRQTTSHSNHDQQHGMRFIGSNSRDGFFEKAANIQQQQQAIQSEFLEEAANLHHQGQFQVGSSKYLVPTQELLNEFCSLGTTQVDASKEKQIPKTKQCDDDNGASSSWKQPLYSINFMELQKRKTKLLLMLEEVDRRYRHYRHQMKAVVSSFEAVAGSRAASVYSDLASKAMSRHFRCLRDRIVGAIQATRKAMGEKDPVAPGTRRGETPRLKIIDKALRQQRCFQQMNMMENQPWRPQRGLPERSVSVLRAWLFEHFLHPVRLWKPMVEEIYMEETKEHENNMASSDAVTTIDGDDNIGRPNPNILLTDQKPTPDQLVRIDSECLSSIVSNDPGKNDAKSAKTLQNQHLHQHHYQKQSFETSGIMELDFSSYSHHHTSGGASYNGSDFNAN
ncbi:hypothetical protein Goari_011778, partial [Gossypium aridum]|nr:hypothetical protein [Gossypium aridum]